MVDWVRRQGTDVNASTGERARTEGQVRTDGGTARRRETGTDGKYCSNCGDYITLEAEVCPSCGVIVITATIFTGAVEQRRFSDSYHRYGPPRW
jgi:uncharacterized OB-fold protein